MKAIANNSSRLVRTGSTLICILTSFLSLAQSPPQVDPCERTFLNFDGADDYLDVQGTTINGNAGTWEAWVRKDDWSSQTNGILFGNDIPFNQTNSMYLSFHAAVGLHFRYGDVSSEPATGGAIYGQFTNGFVADSWHHIAVSWDHVSGTTTLKIFVDGVEQTGFGAGSRVTHNALIDPGSSLNFGFSMGENYLESGSIAEIRTWDFARSQGEIQSDMNSILTGAESGLTGYWPLNEMNGSIVATNLVLGAPTANLTDFEGLNAWETVIEAQLSIEQEGSGIPSGGSFDFGISESGNSLAKTFTITNQSTTILNLNGMPLVEVTGIDALEFSIDLSGTPASIAPSGSTSFDITFSPTSIGSKTASLAIATEDICQPLFTIDLSGESAVTTRPDQILVSNSAPCLDEEITLTIDGGLIFGDTEWTWYEGNASGSPIGSGPSINVTPQQSARYLVRAESMGSPLSDFTTSPTVTLASNTPVVIENEPKDGLITLGNSFEMRVDASGSNLFYQWQKDGVDLSDGGNLSGAQTAILNFGSVTAADNGSYKCLVSNSCTIVESAGAQLTTTSSASTILPYFEDFETNDGGFVSTNLKGPTTWEYGTPIGGANSGTEAWETDLDGLIQDNEINVLTSPNFLLSPSLAGAELSFQINYDLTLFQQSGTPVTDRWFQAAELNISNDNGATWTKISDFEEGGYNRSDGFIFNDANLDWPLWTDNSGGWITSRVNLSDYAGQEVRFRIVMSTTSGFSGWFFGSGVKVDDWSLQEVDNIAPIATISINQATVNNIASEVQLAFTKEVSMTLANLTATNGTLSNLQTIDNKNYTLDVTPSGVGFVSLGIDDSANPIEDLSGNQLANAPQLTFFNDVSNPDAFIYVSEDPVFSSFSAEIVFSKAVSNFELADIGVTNANLSNLQSSDNITFTVDVSPNSTGSVNLSIPAMVAEDQFGNQNNAAADVSIEFNPAVAPFLDPIPSQVTDEEVELTFSASATDLNAGDVIIYSLDAISIGKGMSINGSTGAFSWTPSEAQDGEHTVTLTATDNSSGSLSSQVIIMITINEINQNPTVTIGPSVWNIPEDAYASRSYFISDPDGQDVSISFDDNAQSLGFGILEIFNPVVNKLIFWTAPSEVNATTFDVIVTVTDGIGGSTDFVITINMQEVNQLPALDPIGAQSIDELNELAFTISGSDADVPAQNLTYSISNGLLSGMSLDAATGDFSWIPTELQDGVHAVTFEIADDFSPTSGVSTEEVLISVNEVNTAPALTTIGDQSIDEEIALIFTATATDSDLPANILSYSLDAVSISKGMAIDESTGAFSWTPSENQDGDHTVVVEVTDDGDGNLTDSETVTITVNEVNQSPALNPIPNQTATVGQQLTLTFSGNDADLPENMLMYTLDGISISKGMSVNPMTAEFSWIPSVIDAGTSNNATVTVSDGTLSDSESFTVDVSKVDQVITFNPIPDVDLLSATTVNLIATTDSGLEITYTLTQGGGVLNGSVLTFNDTGLFSVEANQAGNSNYNAASSVTQNFTVTDSRKDDQVIDFPSINDKSYGDVFMLNGTASSGLAVSYVVLSGPATLSGPEVTVTGLGEVAIEASQNGDEGFNPAPVITQTFMVGKATLTATADNKARVYNTDNPTLTISYGGFISGDLEADLDELPTASTTASTTSDARTYPITVSGGSDNNYDFEYVAGELTITKAPATIALSNLEQEVDGSVKLPVITTSPTDLNVEITFDEDVEPQTAGEYAFTATIVETNYAGEETGVLTLIQVLGLFETEVSIYPNPAEDYIKIESDQRLIVEVMSLEGKILMESDSETDLNISELSNGTYLILLINEVGAAKTFRFVKGN